MPARKRSTHTLLSCPLARASYLPGVAMCQGVPCAVSHLHILMFPMGRCGWQGCQGLMMFWDGVSSCYVFSPTLGSFCPGVSGMSPGTVSETEHHQQGSQWGLQAGLSRGWNQAFPNVCQPQNWCSSTVKATFPEDLTLDLGSAA